ncbi:MAG: serine/threonine-protein kinase [Mycobacteriales bacterium]
MPLTPLRAYDPVSIGPHRLLGRLGQGGMGTVFLGVSPDERAVAVKILRDSVADVVARQRFRHELDALRRVRGPHVVEVLDADVDADLPYLVTRFVPGERLDELVTARGPLTGDALHELARGLADALATLHGAGVVHRDLTPGNVLVLDGSPQVIDLGLATAADVTALTRSGLLVGTPGYLAPEQVSGLPVTPAVDVHAWGATVALAGTGRPPYGTGRPEVVLYRIVHESPDLEGLPHELLTLIEAAMRPDARYRPSATDLLRELGGASRAETSALHLPRDVDATALLAGDGLQPLRTAVLDVPGVRQVAYAGSPREHGGYGRSPDEESPYDQDPLVPWDEEDCRPVPSPGRSAQLLATGTAALAVVVTGTLVAPVVTATTAFAAVVLLRAAGRSSDRLALRRERRGDRRRDPVVAALGAPWHLLASLLDTLVSLPLLAAVAAVPAGLVWLLDPTFNGLERPELTAATATTVALVSCLSRRGHRRTRQVLRRALVTATPSAAAGVAVLSALLASAVLLLAAAEGAAPTWWPLDGLRRR